MPRLLSCELSPRAGVYHSGSSFAAIWARSRAQNWSGLQGCNILHWAGVGVGAGNDAHDGDGSFGRPVLCGNSIHKVRLQSKFTSTRARPHTQSREASNVLGPSKRLLLCAGTRAAQQQTSSIMHTSAPSTRHTSIATEKIKHRSTLPERLVSMTLFSFLWTPSPAGKTKPHMRHGGKECDPNRQCCSACSCEGGLLGHRSKAYLMLHPNTRGWRV